MLGGDASVRQVPARRQSRRGRADGGPAPSGARRVRGSATADGPGPRELGKGVSHGPVPLDTSCPSPSALAARAAAARR